MLFRHYVEGPLGHQLSHFPARLREWLFIVGRGGCIQRRVIRAQRSIIRSGESYPARIGKGPGTVGVEFTTIDKEEMFNVVL